MTPKVYFISTVSLKENTPLNFNIEDQLLTMSIWDSQEIHIQPILGTDLYNKLKTDVSNTTISGNYKLLLDDYVIPALTQWVLSEAILYIRYKLMNKNVASQGSDNTIPADINELKYIADQMKNRAEFYSQRLTDYLLDKSSLYPEFTSNNDIDDMKPIGTSYFTGIVLDDGIDCERYMGYNRNTTDIV